MKSNEELSKKYYSLFEESKKENKSIEPIKEEIKNEIKKREFKPIMTEEEFDKIFGDMN